MLVSKFAGKWFVRGGKWGVFLLMAAAAAFSGCNTQERKTDESSSLTAAGSAAVEDGVRGFMKSVAHDVTTDGPPAWLKYFETNPAFFMAVNGQMAFPDNAAASKGTQDFARGIKSIELVWGDDLRVDALKAELAVVGSSWREVQVDNGGHRVEETGYFTALVENREGRWQFRDAHWSSPVGPAPAH